MKIFAYLAAIFLSVASVFAADAPATPAPATGADVCVVVGAPGEDAYAGGFQAAAKAWKDACDKAGISCTIIGVGVPAGGDPSDHDKLQAWIKKLDSNSPAPVWIAFIGHGTFDGREARMNLVGPDVTATEFADWLKPVKRPLVFIDGSSSSAPFLNVLSAPGRIIVTATQNGNESNYARFGERFAEAVADPAADIDQDGQTSVLEAFVTASKKVEDFYKENDRMASEHALIDDNGDKRGTPSDWFQGTRVVKHAAGDAEPDGAKAALIAFVPSLSERSLTAQQLKDRAAYEAELAALTKQKGTIPEDAYYAQLEVILRKLAAIYVPASSPSPAQQSETTPQAASAPSRTAPATPLPESTSPPISSPTPNQ